MISKPPVVEPLNRRITKSPSHQIASAVAAAIVLAVYLVSVRLLPKDVFYSPDEGSKFISLQTIRWQDGLRYDTPYLGRAMDPEFRFHPSRCHQGLIYPDPQPDGAVRFHWPIWFPLASRPFFNRLGFAGLYVIPLLAGWFTALVAGRLAYGLDPRLAPVTILLVGLGTPIFFYSLCFWEHTAATLFATLGATLVAISQPGRRATRWVAVPSLFLALILRIELLAFALAVLVAWVSTEKATRAFHPLATVWSGAEIARRRSMRLVFIPSFAVIALAVLGASLAPRHWQFLLSVPERLLANLGKLPYLGNALVAVFINSNGSMGPALPGVVEALGLLATIAAIGAAFVRSERVEAAIVLPSLAILLAVSVALLLSAQVYRSVNGLVPIAPYVVAGAYALPHGWRQRDYRVLFLAALAGLYLAFGFLALFSFQMTEQGLYHTGLQWGPRYLLPFYPLAAVLAVVSLELYRQSSRRPAVRSAVTGLVAAMIIVAVLFEFRGVIMLYNNRQAVAAWERALEGGEPVVTDCWWLAGAIAPFFVSHQMFCLTELERVTEWVPPAVAQGVRSFTVATLDPIDPGRLSAPGFELRAEPTRVVAGLRITRFQVRAAPKQGRRSPNRDTEARRRQG